MHEDTKPPLVNNYMTQQEVADALNLSREAVNYIEQNALRKLRYFLKQLDYKKGDFL